MDYKYHIVIVLFACISMVIMSGTVLKDKRKIGEIKVMEAE